MERTISSWKSGVKRGARRKPGHFGTGRDAEGMAGTTKDKIGRDIFSSKMKLNCHVVRFALVDDMISAIAAI